jgi:hypothetical protein
VAPCAPLRSSVSRFAGRHDRVRDRGDDGAAMLATKATAYLDNPFLLIKFPAIAMGLINVGALNRTRAWKEMGSRDLSPREGRQLAVFGGMSLACWLTAITCGRMIAFW